MKALFLPGNKRVELRAVAIPKPGPGEVLIAVKASCICRTEVIPAFGSMSKAPRRRSIPEREVVETRERVPAVVEKVELLKEKFLRHQ